MSRIEYLHITPAEAHEHRAGFIEVYRKVFADAPYFETYTPEQVDVDVYQPHIAHGIVIMAYDGQRPVGLGCAKAFVGAGPEDRKFIDAAFLAGSLPVMPANLWYMSEMGVLKEDRHRGIGTHLVAERLKRIRLLDIKYYCFRTAAKDSNSAPLYRSIGAVQLPGTLDMSTDVQVTTNNSQSTQRIFLYGVCDEAIAAVENMAHAA